MPYVIRLSSVTIFGVIRVVCVLAIANSILTILNFSLKPVISSSYIAISANALLSIKVYIL